MNKRKKRFKKRRLVDMAEMLMMTCLPRSTSRCVASHIRQLKCRQQINPIKNFFESGKPPTTLHVVQFVKPGVKLFQQPQHLLPDIWRNYVINDYQRRSFPSKVNDATGSETSSNINSNNTSVKANQNCPVKRNIKKINGQFKTANLQSKKKGKLTLTNQFYSEQSVSKQDEILALCDKTSTAGSKDNTTIKLCKNKESKGKSRLLEERNIIRFKISRFSKMCAEKRATDRNVLDVNTSNNQPCHDQNVKIADTEKLELTKHDNEHENSKNKVVKELSNNKIDTLTDNSNSLPFVPNSDQLSDRYKETESIISHNSCNGELKSVTKESVNSKPTETHVSVNSTTFKLSSQSVSHKPRPPSNVKLKETPNLTTKYNLNKGRFKVPTSFTRSRYTPKS